MSKVKTRFFWMIQNELDKAEEKHPKFFDRLTGARQENMDAYEHRIKMVNKKGPFYAEFILDEEKVEELNAYLKGDKEHCLQELAQCGAVILRMMQFVYDEMEAGK